MHLISRLQVQGSRSLLRIARCTRVHSHSRYRISAMAMAKQDMLTSSFNAKSRVKAQLLDRSIVANITAATPIHAVTASGLDEFLETFEHTIAAAWAKTSKFKAKTGEVLLLPDDKGSVKAVLLGTGDSYEDIWAYAALPGKLPPGMYDLEIRYQAGEGSAAVDKALFGWILGCYKFSRYKTGALDKDKLQTADNAQATTGQQSKGDAKCSQEEDKPMLLIPEGANSSHVPVLAEAFYWCRDMINTPAEDMGPQHLAAEAAALAAAHAGASITTIEGDDLLASNYPAVHTVGRAAARPPVLIDLKWQPSSSSSSSQEAAADLPLVALVGKGVCFDSGGLDLKTAAGMKLMKKDMGGAALMLALAHIIMTAQLPVRLRLLVPAVENAVSGNSYRPGDVLQTRAGLTVENGNTDAEGRLILSDAIYEAASCNPDVLIDAATLTGAARVALGPELPVVFSNNDDTWRQLEAASKQEADPLWRLPLWPGYRKMLDSKVADISSTGEPGQAGAITAALFLSEFAKQAQAWVHIDTAGWVSGGSTGPGKPEGGEALGLRALWRFLQEKYKP